MHLIVAGNTRSAILRLHGRIKHFNNCRLTGTLLDGRQLRMISIHGLNRVKGMRFKTWECDVDLTPDQIDLLNASSMTNR